MTTTAEPGAWLEGLREAIEDAGLPAGLAVKPDTAAGQPWAIISLMSAVFDGDIEGYNSDQDALVLVRCVGYTVQQANAAYWRADSAVFDYDSFAGGTVVFRTRDSVTTPVRDDSTFPNRSVYYVDAMYRLWTASTTGA